MPNLGSERMITIRRLSRDLGQKPSAEIPVHGGGVSHAIIEEPLALTSGEQHAERPLGSDRTPGQRQLEGSSARSTTRRSASCTALPRCSSSFSVALCALIRTQLAFPESGFLSADVHNQIFTMHGVTMIFLFVMPFAAAFANYLILLQIGVCDVAFLAWNALVLGPLAEQSSSTRRGSSAAAPTGLVLLLAQLGSRVLAEPWRRLLRPGSADRGYRLTRVGDQPDRHVSQHAGARHDPHAHAGPHLDAAGDAVPAAVRPAGHHGGAVPADVRPPVRLAILRP